MAIARSCDAFGIQDIHLIFSTEAPFDPRRIGNASSSSANKWIDFHIHRSASSCIGRLKSEGFKIISAVIGKGAESVFDADFSSEHIAIMVGNEHSGLSQLTVDASDRMITIPMAGMVESLNVSVATAILLYEVTKQRIQSGLQKSLSEPEKRKLTADFSKR
jgi:tRNA (guanosine-2'-O-)-methyltransferase